MQTVRGWDRMLLEKTDDGAEAFHLFFQLLAEFRARERQTQFPIRFSSAAQTVGWVERRVGSAFSKSNPIPRLMTDWGCQEELACWVSASSTPTYNRFTKMLICSPCSGVSTSRRSGFQSVGSTGLPRRSQVVQQMVRLRTRQLSTKQAASAE